MLLVSERTRLSAILTAVMTGMEPCCSNEDERLYRGRPLAENPTSWPRPPEPDDVSANVAGTAGQGFR